MCCWSIFLPLVPLLLLMNNKNNLLMSVDFLLLPNGKNSSAMKKVFMRQIGNTQIFLDPLFQLEKLAKLKFTSKTLISKVLILKFETFRNFIPPISLNINLFIGSVCFKKNDSFLSLGQLRAVLYGRILNANIFLCKNCYIFFPFHII